MSRKTLGIELYGFPKAPGSSAPVLPLDEWPRTDSDCEFWWSQRGLSSGDVGNPLDTMVDWSTNSRDAPAASAAWNAVLTGDHRADVISIGSRRGIAFNATAQAGPFPNNNTGQGYVIPAIPQGSPSAVVAIFRPGNSDPLNGFVMELGGFSQSPEDTVAGASKFMMGGQRYFRAGASFYTIQVTPEWGVSGSIDVRYVEDNSGGTDLAVYDRADSASALTPTIVFGSYSDPSVAFADTTMTIGFRSHPTNDDYQYTEGDLLELMVFSNRGKLSSLNTYLSTYYADLIV